MDFDGHGILMLPLFFAFIISIFLTAYIVRKMFADTEGLLSVFLYVIFYIILFLPVMVAITYLLLAIWVLFAQGPSELYRQLT